jgi:hypothetical protein
VTFPADLDVYDFCSEDLKKELEGPRAALKEWEDEQVRGAYVVWRGAQKGGLLAQRPALMRPRWVPAERSACLRLALKWQQPWAAAFQAPSLCLPSSQPLSTPNNHLNPPNSTPFPRLS